MRARSWLTRLATYHSLSKTIDAEVEGEMAILKTTVKFVANRPGGYASSDELT